MESILVHTSWQHFSEGRGCFPGTSIRCEPRCSQHWEKVGAGWGGSSPVQIIFPFGLWKPLRAMAASRSPRRGKKCRPMAPGARREARPSPGGRSFRPQPEVGSSRPGTLFGGEGSLRTNAQRVSHRLEAGRASDSVPPSLGLGCGPGRSPGLATRMAPPPLERARSSGSCGSAIRGDREKRLSQTQST